MRASSYAVSWDSADGRRCAGRLDIGAAAATLTGAVRGDRRHETVPFDDISRVRLERGRLHIARRAGRPLLIVSLDGPGALREAAELLAEVV